MSFSNLLAKLGAWGLRKGVLFVSRVRCLLYAVQ